MKMSNPRVEELANLMKTEAQEDARKAAANHAADVASGEIVERPTAPLPVDKQEWIGAEKPKDIDMGRVEANNKAIRDLQNAKPTDRAFDINGYPI